MYSDLISSHFAKLSHYFLHIGLTSSPVGQQIMIQRPKLCHQFLWIFWEKSHTHSFTYCLCLLSNRNGRNEWERLLFTELKIFTICFFIKLCIRNSIKRTNFGSLEPLYNLFIFNLINFCYHLYSSSLPFFLWLFLPSQS